MAKRGVIVVSAIGIAIALGGCSGPHIKTVTSEQASIQKAAAAKRSSEIHKEKIEAKKAWDSQLKAESEIENKLGSLNFQSGYNPVVKINKGASTLSLQDWQKSIVLFQLKDHQNRTSHMVTAYLDKKNFKLVKNEPNHAKVEGYSKVLDNNHHPVLVKANIIDHSLLNGIKPNGSYSSKQNKINYSNPYNSVVLTSYCQNTLVQPYVKQIQNALKSNAKVVVQVMPVFYKNDKLCKGVWLQAKGTNGLNFDVFVFNVQPGYQLNYQTGKVTPNGGWKVGNPQF